MGTYSIGEVIQRRLKLERSVQARGEAVYPQRYNPDRVYF